TDRGSGQDFGWHQTGWQPNEIPFTATPGPRNAAAELESNVPANFLELFMTDELLQHVADETNLYAGQYFQAHPESLPHSRGNSWSLVSVAELKTFFGLSFLTGYVKKPSLYLYWSMDEVDATPYFNKTMSRNRFQIIWRYLHYNNNESQDASNKMYKVRPVLDYVVQKFKELYQPRRNLCVDEGMMQWWGRLSFRVYNPQKPVKYGIKSYILCDSATGYCFNMRPYVGEASTLSETVLSLLDRLPGHGYTLYMNNFYNSVALCEHLLRAKINLCGTLRKNRGEPKIISDLTKTDLVVGERVMRHNESVMVVAWQDKRLVKMVTTCHQDRMQRVEVWQRGQKTKVPQMKPECVVVLDKNIAYYPFIRRSLDWSKKFVAYLFQICMFNAYVIYGAKSVKTLLEFMRRVVKTWTATQYVGEEEEEEEVAGVETEGSGDLVEGQHTTLTPTARASAVRHDCTARPVVSPCTQECVSQSTTVS
uniref:PiggyBac transposable element-derived protein domain-containing protein n=1 Tax=Gouania willdenowi TaxID=441366 RepID=A0A8C5DHQ7_GOUWI